MSRTTAYHPQGDGMVKRLNHSLLQMLRAYAQDQADWECHLPLVLYVYHTAVHTSTGVSAFELMYGHSPEKSPFRPALPMTHHRANSSYRQIWRNYRILWRHILQRQHTCKGILLFKGHGDDFSALVIHYECPFSLQESWVLTGRESDVLHP